MKISKIMFLIIAFISFRDCFAVKSLDNVDLQVVRYVIEKEKELKDLWNLEPLYEDIEDLLDEGLSKEQAIAQYLDEQTVFIKKDITDKKNIFTAEMWELYSRLKALPQ